VLDTASLLRLCIVASARKRVSDTGPNFDIRRSPVLETKSLLRLCSSVHQLIGSSNRVSEPGFPILDDTSDFRVTWGLGTRVSNSGRHFRLSCHL